MNEHLEPRVGSLLIASYTRCDYSTGAYAMALVTRVRHTMKGTLIDYVCYNYEYKITHHRRGRALSDFNSEYNRVMSAATEK